MQGPMRHVINTIATSHEFFANSRIPDARFKRQDYVSLAFAMALYQGTKDIKAPDLKKMVGDFSDADKMEQVLNLSAAVGDALSILARIDDNLTRRITQKWIFVDLCWLVMQHQVDTQQINAAELAESFDAFEMLRREYTSHPEDLIRTKDEVPKQNRLNRHMYEYITAFRAQGATHANLKIRNVALRAFCR